jgi:hypothetical protein
MTEKQRIILEKYLTKDRIDKLNQMSFKTSSSLIDMILHFKSYHTVCGEMCNIPFLIRTPTEEEVFVIEEMVNKNRSLYGLATDEYASLFKVKYIPRCKELFVVKQTWFKGMSNSPTCNYANLHKDGSKVEGIYNMLFDAEIYSIVGLTKSYADELQKTIK